MRDFSYTAHVGNLQMDVGKDGKILSINVAEPLLGQIGYTWHHINLKPGMETLRAKGDRGFNFKIKMMKNGELRLAVQVPDHGWYTMTIAPQWRPGVDPLPVQDSHHHLDEHEFYRMIEGWSVGIWLEMGRRWRADMFDGHRPNFSFGPGEDHNIIPGPGAVFITWKKLTDTPGYTPAERGNPDRNGNNWWPTDCRLWDEMEPNLVSLEALAWWMERGVNQFIT